MKYYYIGLTRHREQVRGVIDAADEVEAKMRLRAMQIRPTEVGESRAGATPFDYRKILAFLPHTAPIDLKGLCVFTRQFSSLIDSGVPIVQCLDILWQQERRKGFKRILGRVKEDIEAGMGLADALGKHPTVFSEFFVRIVEAGEISGTLDKAMRRVGIQLEKLGKLRAKVIGALIYPLFTMFVAVVILVFLLVKVIPEIAKLYKESSAQLPVLTQDVLAVSQYVQDHYVMIMMIIIGVPFTCSILYRFNAVRKIVDPLVLKVPLFGNLIRKSMVARFSRTMSTLVASGVPLLSSFEICIKLIGNLALKETLRKAANYVTEGKSIAQGLASSTVFPPMVIHMVNIGEMTGRLDELLGKVADIYDDEVDDAVSAITGMLNPILIIVVGGIVAFLLIAMYLPIFQLAEKAAGGM
jgi:type IV pilus assembly protein PilC